MFCSCFFSSKISFRLLNSLNHDLAQTFGLNCWQRLSAKDTVRERVTFGGISVLGLYCLQIHGSDLYVRFRWPNAFDLSLQRLYLLSPSL